MNHVRARRAVFVVTGIYVLVLITWAVVLRPQAPNGTIPYQIAILVFGYGAALGLAMMVAGRPSAADRRLHEHGLEGWAVIDGIHTTWTDDTSRTELEVTITVPGQESFTGVVLRDDLASRHSVGDTIMVRVDPDDRGRIWM